MKSIAKNFNDSCNVFVGAPTAAAGAGGDGNAGEDGQAASVSGVQPEPQAAVGSGDQAQPQSPQEFAGEQVARLVDEHKFFKQNRNFSGSGRTDILLCSPWMLQPI